MEKLPVLSNKHFDAMSAFRPDNLLREARRQKGLPVVAVPKICILDPDGDIVRYLRAAARADRHAGWACYHTDLYVFQQDDAVGAAFAVLVAEQLFASGCQLLISVTHPGKFGPFGRRHISSS
jgi:hypothetical protein